MSELYETVSSGSEGERSETTTGVMVDTSVSEWQRSLGAEAAAEAPAPLPAEPTSSSSEDEATQDETTATQEVPTTPERRPSPVEPLAPLPAAPSSEETETEDEDERSEGERSETTATDEDDDGGAVVQQLFVGPSDSIPLLDVERLGLRHREVGCSATPTMRPAVDELTEGEMSDLESDVGDVPNEAGRLAEVVGLDLVFTDEAMAEMARRMPLWLRIVGVTVCLLYLGLFIRSVRCM